jgi:hypothetical protein
MHFSSSELLSIFCSVFKVKYSSLWVYWNLAFKLPSWATCVSVNRKYSVVNIIIITIIVIIVSNIMITTITTSTNFVRIRREDLFLWILKRFGPLNFASMLNNVIMSKQWALCKYSATIETPGNGQTRKYLYSLNIFSIMPYNLKYWHCP